MRMNQGNLPTTLVSCKSEHTDKNTKMSFTTSTEEIKQTLIDHIKFCQEGDEDDKTKNQEEQELIMKYLKQSLFAKHIHVKRKGHKEFCSRLEQLRIKAVANANKSNGSEIDDVDNLSKKLKEVEKTLIEHYVENLKNQKLIE